MLGGLPLVLASGKLGLSPTKAVRDDTAQQGSSMERPLCRATSKAPVVPFPPGLFSFGGYWADAQTPVLLSGSAGTLNGNRDSICAKVLALGSSLKT